MSFWHDYASQSHNHADVGHFLTHYFANTDAADLAQFASNDLAQSALSHATLNRPAASHTVRINTYPQQSAFGAGSTVIDIVNDDMPFLIDSLIMLLNRHHLRLTLLLHPIFGIRRDENGKLAAWCADAHAEGFSAESWIQVRLPAISATLKTTLNDELNQILTALRRVVADEAPMRRALAQVRQAIAAQKQHYPAEIPAFLDWLAANHFLFMGYARYDVAPMPTGTFELVMHPESRLGVLAQQEAPPFSPGFAALSSAEKNAWLKGEPLLLNKSRRRSLIHRDALCDMVGIQIINDAGQTVGQWRFVGLYTSTAYSGNVWDIPVLRSKCQEVTAALGYPEGSYRDKTLRYVLQSYPRDELFEIGTAALAPLVAGLVGLQERPRTRLFVRADVFKRYVSAMLFTPAHVFNTQLRIQIENLLRQAFAAEDSTFAVRFGDSPLARVHFLFSTRAATLPAFDVNALEAQIVALVRGWKDEFARLGAAGHPEALVWAEAFPAAYRETFPPTEALQDTLLLTAVANGAPLAMRWQCRDKTYAPIELKTAYHGSVPSLSQTLPVIENLGVSVVEELPFAITLPAAEAIGLSHMGLAPKHPAWLAAFADPNRQHELSPLLQAALKGEVENDGFNALVAAANLKWRDTVLLRALAKYLRQAGLGVSQPFMESCLQQHAAITAELVALFYARLHPQEHDEARAQALQSALETALAAVENAEDDRILRAFFSVILAVVRTNFWQTGALGTMKDTVSFKIASAAIDFLPKPQPLFEIWVYSPRMEGIHLRFGKVARGGLRWSERREDFRTEVLGLVKAQFVKNAVIIPTGAKGGFVCKQLPNPSEREAWRNEGIACYTLFIQALLDLTDNIVQGAVVPPPQVYRRDDDDPYLVVAADKGTAAFSDIANAISAEYGFWLGDAFASGGSQGYDHKAMGITARGAWESVKRHFRHLGKNIQEEDFTVVGIGDMAGDVFGNGMLLSRHIRLQAAFNHRHIFLDPNPDAAVSFQERQRLFEGVLGWDAYDPTLISAGGGVFSRNAKSIPLSPQVRQWLGIDAASLPPNRLIRELLKAPVELLYNGGIGTYIKAASESHADARDRANDDTRVNGCEIRAKVLGEGGNLGATQLGRIEYCQHGGLCHTDAIDNSAGVDCSDHEVNIKILLGNEIRQQRLDEAGRNHLLKIMTPGVAALVLRDNYLQTQILSMNRLQAAQFLPAHAALMAFLEHKAGLNRTLEFLPNDAEIKKRLELKQGLTTPEMAVLLAYSKIQIQAALLHSDLPDETAFAAQLAGYFPKELQTPELAQSRQEHFLRRDIIASVLTNRIVNRMGMSFVQRLSEDMNASEADVVRAYVIADGLFEGENLFAQLEALDNRIDAAWQMALMGAVARLLSRVARILLRDKRPFGDAAALIAHYRDAVIRLQAALPELVPESAHPQVAAQAERLAGVNGLFSTQKAFFARLAFAENIISIKDLSEDSGKDLGEVFTAYYHAAHELKSDWLYHSIARLPRGNRWQTQANLAVREDVETLVENAARRLLHNERPDFAAAQTQIQALADYPQPDLAMISALVRQLVRLMAA